MPLWGAPRAGANPISELNFVDLRPGDYETLLDGTETIATGSRSIAFARGGSGSGADEGATYAVTGCPNGSTIDIQASSTKTYKDDGTPRTLDEVNASFVNVSAGGSGGTVIGNGFYTDTGRSMFYRLIVTTFVSGDVPVVVVKR